MVAATASPGIDGAEAGLREAMRARRRVLVAFSGGVDSGLVARLAHDALGKDALAAIADAESLARSDLEAARASAEEIGIPVRTVRVSELANPSYAANPRDRCYFCRTELGTALVRLARDLGYATIADGVNLTDLGDVRPGIRAMDESGFWHPLVEFRLGKPEVRQLARRLGLSFADRPSNSCLSSRIAYGEVITLDKLRRVETAEEALRALGFPLVRVRAQDGAARIEVPLEDLPRLAEPGTCRRAHEAVLAAGFLQVTVDPRGYRSGSMNEAP